MANENPVVEAPPENVAPNLDAELDAALSKSFPNNGIPNETEKNEPPKQEVKAEAKPEVQADIKPETKRGDKNQDKPIVDEKPLLTAEEVDKIEPKKQDAWTALKNNNKRSLRLIEQKEAEIAKLKAVVAEKGALSQKEVEALKLENGELSKYRAMIDIEADPEFVSKFDQPIENITKGIKSMIKSMLVGTNTSDETLNQLDVSNSKIMEDIIGNIGETRDKFVARKMERMVEELLNLKDKRNETLAEQKEKYKETLEARKKQTFEKDVESEGRALKRLEGIVAAKDQAGNPAFPFLFKKEAKDGLTQPEVDQINGHNKMVDLMNQKVQQAYKMNTPEERMEVAVAAAGAHYLSALLKAETAKRKSVEAELQKISAVNSETEKTKTPSIRRNGNGSDNLDLDVALTSHFNR